MGTELRHHRHLQLPDEHLPVTHRLLHSLLRIVMITAVLLPASGCFLGPGQTDQGSDIVSQLQIEIPESATDITGNTDTGVDFLMPNSEWREYVAEYYPNATMSEFPPLTLYETPVLCRAALNTGVNLAQYVTGDDITVGRSKHTMRRAVLVTPNCQDGKALVQWVLREK